MKEDLLIEWYLTCGLSLKIVNYLARLRGGLLRIAVNEGRWGGIPRENRKCTFCNAQVIEDEEHFIFDCRLWSGTRTTLRKYPEFRDRSFRAMFESKNLNLLKDLYLFIVISLRERENWKLL